MKTRALGALVLVALSLVGVLAMAQDNPPAQQGPGEHSTIVTSNGTIRDDELAKMIADAITNSGNTPSSVKVFFNSCYGGGMLDDIANALGPANFPPGGIPVVGASASDADQPAWGPGDGYAGATGSGSFWTNGLAGAITGASPGQSVSGAVGAANAADPTAPGGAYAGSLPAGGEPENPQNTSANGGGSVNWSSGAQSVVFGGGTTNTRHGNNVSKMEDAFLDMWGSDPNSNVWSTGGNPNGSGSTQDLQGMLNGACQNLSPGQELVIYIDDHGNTEFDFGEWWDWFKDQVMGNDQIVIDPINGWKSDIGGLWPTLHEGWEQGLSGNVRQGEAVEPGLLALADIPFPVPHPDQYLDVLLDGNRLDLPDMLMPGEQAFIPVDWPLLTPGPHLLEFVPDPTNPLPFPVTLLNLELTSGPINELTFNIPEPASIALLLLLLAPASLWWLRRRARPAATV